MHRVIFCSYWLYYNGFRGVFGYTRLLDYIAFSLIVLGLLHLLNTRLLNWKLIGWVSIFSCPLFLTAILDPSTYVISYVLKMYAVALYFACYFKSMRLTAVELVCFAVPIVVNIYFFLYPRPLDEYLLLQGRTSGIAEPNSTSLSLIISMCGAFGIYVLTEMKKVKVAAIVIAIVAFFGIILTASRAGFIGAAIAICLFLLMERRIRFAGLAAAVAAVIIAFNFGGVSLNELTVFQRFKSITNSYDPLMAIISERPFIEIAWDTVNHGEWFIGGGPQQVTKWGIYFQHVPHNSLLDIGIAFGKVSFYFYGALLVALLVVNTLVIAANWRCRDHVEKSMLFAPMLFLSLLPMYMSLSLGMTMGFILWMVLGIYPLFHEFPKFVKSPSKSDKYSYVKV